LILDHSMILDATLVSDVGAADRGDVAVY